MFIYLIIYLLICYTQWQKRWKKKYNKTELCIKQKWWALNRGLLAHIEQYFYSDIVIVWNVFYCFG